MTVQIAETHSQTTSFYNLADNSLSSISDTLSLYSSGTLLTTGLLILLIAKSTSFFLSLKASLITSVTLKVSQL